jgi:hypothetical protein
MASMGNYSLAISLAQFASTKPRFGYFLRPSSPSTAMVDPERFVPAVDWQAGRLHPRAR